MASSIIDNSNTIVIQAQKRGRGDRRAKHKYLCLSTQEAPTGWASGQTYGAYKTASAVAVDFGVTFQRLRHGLRLLRSES